MATARERSASQIGVLKNIIENIYLIRKKVMNNLANYEVARLMYVLELTLTDAEKLEYTNPIRDLFTDLDGIRKLMLQGYTVTILGKDVDALMTMTSSPGGYETSLNNGTRLKIFVVITDEIVRSDNNTTEDVTTWANMQNWTNMQNWANTQDRTHASGGMTPHHIICSEWHKVVNTRESTVDTTVCFEHASTITNVEPDSVEIDIADMVRSENGTMYTTCINVDVSPIFTYTVACKPINAQFDWFANVQGSMLWLQSRPLKAFELSQLSVDWNAHMFTPIFGNKTENASSAGAHKRPRLSRASKPQSRRRIDYAHG